MKVYGVSNIVKTISAGVTDKDGEYIGEIQANLILAEAPKMLGMMPVFTRRKTALAYRDKYGGDIFVFEVNGKGDQWKEIDGPALAIR